MGVFSRICYKSFLFLSSWKFKATLSQSNDRLDWFISLLFQIVRIVCLQITFEAPTFHLFLVLRLVLESRVRYTALDWINRWINLSTISYNDENER